MSGTRITTPFGPASTAAEVIAGVDLTGKRAIVTGASSGIGQETARALAGAGAEVTLAVRDIAAGEKAAAAIAARRATRASASRGWTSQTAPRSASSSPAGRARCTSW